MAVGKEFNENYELHELLEIWGIEIEGFSSAVITIDEDSIVTVMAVHRKELDHSSAEKVGKRYALVELKNE